MSRHSCVPPLLTQSKHPDMVVSFIQQGDKLSLAPLALSLFLNIQPYTHTFQRKTCHTVRLTETNCINYTRTHAETEKKEKNERHGKNTWVLTLSPIHISDNPEENWCSTIKLPLTVPFGTITSYFPFLERTFVHVCVSIYIHTFTDRRQTWYS